MVRSVINVMIYAYRNIFNMCKNLCEYREKNGHTSIPGIVKMSCCSWREGFKLIYSDVLFHLGLIKWLVESIRHLPDGVRSATSLTSFRSKLKSDLPSYAYIS